MPLGKTTRSVALAGLLLVPVSARAQFVETQTRPGGQLGDAGASFETIEEGLDTSLWRAGAFRIDPWLGLRDAGLVDNLRLETGTQAGSARQALDFRAIGGAGLKLYVPFGTHVIVAGNALHEYNWWASGDGRNIETTSGGAGLYVSGNRADLSLAATRREAQEFASQQLDILSVNERESADAALAVRLVRSMYLTTRFSTGEVESRATEEAFSEVASGLDRDTEASAVGLQFLLGGTMNIRTELEDREVDFVDGRNSHRSTAPVLDFRYQGPRFEYRLNVGYWDLEPAPGATIAPFQEALGTMSIRFDPPGRFMVTPFASRRAQYSLQAAEFGVAEGFSHYLARRAGVSLEIAIATRIRLTLGGDLGTDDYVRAAGSPGPRREDDVTGWSFSLQVPLTRRLSLNLNGDTTTYDSPAPNADRTRSRFGLGFGLGLSGSGAPEWTAWP